MVIGFACRVCGRLWDLYQIGLRAVIRRMDDMVLKFADRFLLTAEEQRVVVIDDKEGALLRNTRVFLVGRVLTSKTFSKERFKR